MGAYLSTPNTNKTSSDGANDAVAFGSSAMQGWRLGMEDAHATLLDIDDQATHLFGVYDGHGGKEVALYCAKHLPGAIKGSANLAEALSAAYLKMDVLMRSESARRELEALAGESREDSGRKGGAVAAAPEDQEEEVQGGHKSHTSEAEAEGSQTRASKQSSSSKSTYEGPTAGSTAVTAVMRGDTLIVANAGDSRAVLSRKGQAIELSKDHKPDSEIERTRILAAGGFIADGRVNGVLALSRAIGDMEYKSNPKRGPEAQIVTAHPDIKQVQLQDGDEFLLLACDGIWDVMSSQEAVDFVHQRLHKREKLSQIVEEMFNTCIAPDTGGTGLGCDNMSAVLVVFKQFIAVPESTANPSLRRSSS
eukprot:jgi/Chlat1/3160/Chrsp219S03309